MVRNFGTFGKYTKHLQINHVPRIRKLSTFRRYVLIIHNHNGWCFLYVCVYNFLLRTSHMSTKLKIRKLETQKLRMISIFFWTCKQILIPFANYQCFSNKMLVNLANLFFSICIEHTFQKNIHPIVSQYIIMIHDIFCTFIC